MPLFGGFRQTVADGRLVPWTEDVGTMRATWTDPTGRSYPLSDTSADRGYFTTDQIAGWGAQPYEFVTDPMSRGGEQVRFIRAKPARLTWPLHIYGDTHQQFVNRYRELRRAFLMTVHRGAPGLLTVARPDGSARCIEAYYEDGWGGEAGQNWLSASPVITLYCPDGSWRDTEWYPLRFDAGSPVDFANPFLSLSSAQVLGATDVINPGEITAWPQWTITGPCSQVTATNNTTGQTFTLTHALDSGDTITITTNRPTVRDSSDNNLIGELNWPTAYLWGLVPGHNSVTFVVSDADSNTHIELGFYPRYEGA